MLSTFLTTMNKAKPFIKWAGGKTQLIKKLGNYFPDFEGTYYEPFIGGGAVFFHLKPEKAVLGDANEELINLFKIIKKKPKELMERLNQHQSKVQNKEYYLDIRSWDIQKLDDIETAARTIFLNKTCFNGLYRVNSKGQFNVPFGRTSQGKPPKLYSKENIEACSKALKNVVLRCEDFYEIVKKTGPGDFVYLDPPYHAPNKASMYSKLAYSDELQDRVAQFYHDLAKTGAKVMLNNSATLEILKDSHESIKELYENKSYHSKVLDSKWSIGAIGEWRGKRGELMVLNYEPKDSFDLQEQQTLLDSSK